MHHVSRIVLGGLACAFALSGEAQTGAAAYPVKPVRMIISFVPGGPNDIVGRALARQLEDGLGQSIIVDNRGGANGTLGSSIAAKAPADGYTLLIGSLGSIAISPNINSKLSYDPLKDFEHVAMVAIVGNMLVVHPSVPAKTLKDLIGLAKGHPGKLNYGSVGGTSHLMAEMLNHIAGIRTIHVPYKGAAPALIGLLGGEVDFFMNAFPGLLPHIKAGKLRALAVTTEKRSPFAPAVPTMIESGLSGFSASTWFSLIAPAGTPREIVVRLNQVVVNGLRTPQMGEALANMHAEAVISTPQQASQFVREELQKWGKAVKMAGVKPE